MKTKTLILMLLLTGSSVLYSQSTEPITPGPHGGTVKATEGYCIEMLSPGGILNAFLLDKCWNPMDNKEMMCEVRYLFHDGKETTLKLVRLGKDGFRTEEAIGQYSSCLLTFELKSREVSVRFNNEEALLGMK
jgi:hypothetical protein